MHVHVAILTDYTPILFAATPTHHASVLPHTHQSSMHCIIIIVTTYSLVKCLNGLKMLLIIKSP